LIGGGALLLFAVGTNVQAGWVLTTAALLLGILAAGVALPLTALRGVEVTRAVPKTATAGLPVPVTIAVANTSRRPKGMFRITDSFCGDGWAYVGGVAPGTSREYVGDRLGARRGVYSSGACTIETGAPFGLVNVRRAAPIGSPIVVYPRVYPVPERALHGRSPASATTDDVSSVREYKPGDPLKHIHWRSVAKRGRLVVREFESERIVEAAVVAQLPPDRDVGDAVASIACSFALAFLRRGEVQLIDASDDETRVTRTRSSDRVLDWGARLEPRNVDISELIGRVDVGNAVVYVGEAASIDVAAMSKLSARTSALSVVLVRELDSEQGVVEQIVARLRASGVAVAEVAPSDVETWFSKECAFA
jgi:uncharacterized protein (DUF58 family)